MDERDLTTDQLVDAWRQAEIEINGTALGSKEHDEALRRSDEARGAYLLRMDVMKEDLRDG